MPPNGRSGVVQVGWLTNTMPASMRLATRLPRAISLVKTDPPNPKSETLASATASSSLLTRNRSATGPKSSSLYAGLPGLMFARIVGCMNDPGRSIGLPPMTKVAPSARARLPWYNCWIRSNEPSPIDSLATHDQSRTLGEGSFDLIQQLYQGPFRGQGAERRRLVQRVSWREGCQGCLKFVEKAVGQFFDDDESLRRDTALAHVVHLGPDRPLDRLVEVRVLKHDEGVAPAKLHRRLLEVFSSSGGNQSSRFDAARQRDALDPGIVDHLSDLVMRDQQVGVRAHRRPRFQPQLLKSDGTLRNTPCVLHHDDIARHQVGRGKTRELVVGKVPGLDAEQHAERATFDLSFARARLEVLWCEEALGVLGIVVEDVRAEHHLAPGLGDELTHLERHGASKLVDAGAHDSGGLCDHGRPPGESRVPPVLEAGRCVSKRRLKLVVGEFLERFQNLPVIWVNALVSHRVCPLLNPTLLVTLAGIAHTQTPGMKTRARVICRPISSQFG